MLAQHIARSFMPAGAGAYAPDDDYWYQNRTPTPMAGVNVSPDSALQVDAFFACLRVIAESMAYVPWFVYRRMSNGGKERAPEHPLYSKLHDQPNKWQTAFEWKEMMAGHIILRGHAYNEIVAGPDGPFDQFVPLHPDRVTPEKLPSGFQRYRYVTENGQTRILTHDQIFHIPGLWGGQSILGGARENLGEAIAAQNFSARSFQNKITPPGALKYPGKFKDEAAAKRLRSSWNDVYGGPENAGKVIILEEGMEWQQLGMTNEDAQFLQTRQMMVPTIARRFRMPLIMIGYESNTSNFGTGVEQYQLIFLVHTMLPWFGRFESKANTDLVLQPQEFFTEFLADAVLRGDARSRAEALQIARINGAINGNEWRLIENRNPVPEGEMFWRPANMIPADSPAPTQQPPAAPPGQRPGNPNSARFAAVLAGQIVRKEGERLKALARRFADDGIAWEASVRDFYAELQAETSERFSLPAEWAASYADGACTEVLEHGVAVIEGWEERKIQALVALMEASS